ncbi:MAG TPA: hypothetical protein VJ438_02390 [Candidatus Nanoarchaeia archaeon]|nr:hypothetical protein [Candidatus Nanoarchaeia archaeon]
MLSRLYEGFRKYSKPISFGVVCAVAVTLANMAISKDMANKAPPKAVYVRDVDGDSRQDIIVDYKLDVSWQEPMHGIFVFLQQEDGTYKRLEEILKEQQQKQRGTIEAKLRAYETLTKNKILHE